MGICVIIFLARSVFIGRAKSETAITSALQSLVDLDHVFNI